MICRICSPRTPGICIQRGAFAILSGVRGSLVLPVLRICPDCERGRINGSDIKLSRLLGRSQELPAEDKSND